MSHPNLSQKSIPFYTVKANSLAFQHRRKSPQKASLKISANGESSPGCISEDSVQKKKNSHAVKGTKLKSLWKRASLAMIFPVSIFLIIIFI